MKKSKYRPFYEKLKDHYGRAIKELEDSRDEQAFFIDEMQSRLRKEKLARQEIGNRLEKIQSDGRALAVEDLMVHYHEIKNDTKVLWITSPNVAIVNHGTMANITDRLRRLCPFLDAIMFTAGDVELEKLTDGDLEKFGLMRIKKG